MVKGRESESEEREREREREERERGVRGEGSKIGAIGNITCKLYI